MSDTHPKVPNLSQEMLAFMAQHEMAHALIARQAARRTADIAQDIVINDALKVNWRDGVRKHLDSNFKLEMPDQITIMEDLSVVIPEKTMHQYVAEIEKIQRFNKKAVRMGFRRAKAQENKARRKAKKKAQTSRRKGLTLLQSF